MRKREIPQNFFRRNTFAFEIEFAKEPKNNYSAFKAKRLIF